MSPNDSADSLVDWAPGRAAGSWSKRLGLAMRRYLYCGIIPTEMPDDPVRGWSQLLQPQDLVWFGVFGVAVATGGYNGVWETAPLVALGVAQILEPKFPAAP